MGDHEHAPFAVLLDRVERRRFGPPAETPSPDAPASTEAERWARHVADCSVCREVMTEIEQVLATLAAGEAEDAPETWVRRAELRAVPRHFLTPLRGEGRAEFVFDSALESLAGTRSSPTDSRQVVFAWDRLEVEMTIAPGSAATPWTLSGQVFAHEGAMAAVGDCRVSLLEDDRELERTRTTRTGEFLLGTRPRGAFHVRIEGDGWALDTPDIEP